MISICISNWLLLQLYRETVFEFFVEPKISD